MHGTTGNLNSFLHTFFKLHTCTLLMVTHKKGVKCRKCSSMVLTQAGLMSLYNNMESLLHQVLTLHYSQDSTLYSILRGSKITRLML